MRFSTAAGAFLMSLSACTAEAQKPDAEQFKTVFDQQQQKLKTPGFTQRTVLFENVTPGKRSGGTSTFLVTATVHDYGPGYPANRYFGQTCVGRMEKWPFEMKKNDFGEWIVQGRMTITDGECKDNPAEGVSATPVEGLPGRRAKQPAPDGDRKSTAKAQAPAAMPLGEYACYGVGSRLMAGMGFVLKSGGSYADVDGARGGRWVHDGAAATLTFNGGFLDGEVGRKVRASGFDLSSTVSCEPWK